jgi:hypothetical protein
MADRQSRDRDAAYYLPLGVVKRGVQPKQDFPTLGFPEVLSWGLDRERSSEPILVDNKPRHMNDVPKEKAFGTKWFARTATPGLKSWAKFTASLRDEGQATFQPSNFPTF